MKIKGTSNGQGWLYYFSKRRARSDAPYHFLGNFLLSRCSRNPPPYVGGYGWILKMVDFIRGSGRLRAVIRNLNLNLLLNALLLTGAAVGF